MLLGIHCKVVGGETKQKVAERQQAKKEKHIDGIEYNLKGRKNTEKKNAFCVGFPFSELT